MPTMTSQMIMMAPAYYGPPTWGYPPGYHGGPHYVTMGQPQPYMQGPPPMQGSFC